MLGATIAALGCAIEDGTAFGAPFTIGATPAPFVEKGEVVFQASYKTDCPSSSSFDLYRFGEEKAGETGAPRS